MTSYENFLKTKAWTASPCGFDASAIHSSLFPFQSDLVAWACRIGRAAIFADTGLGKSRMQLEWARNVATRGDVLILAPLAVASQTVREGAMIGVMVNLCRDGTEVVPGITITNYDRLHRFDPSKFTGIVLDESSIIKHEDAKTFAALTEAFRETPYRLCATATPAPNDFAELGTHAEFLGISTRQEMLSEFFIHDAGDTGTWRLKGHARKAFWEWVASWGALLRRPSDLGHSDAGYDLPPLVITHHKIATSADTLRNMGVLFAEEARDLTERRNARKASVAERVKQCAALVNSLPDESWLVWGDLNDETGGITELISGAVEVRGPDDRNYKERSLLDFADGKIRVLVSKSSIAGFGMNFQRCSHMAFIGVNDSYEAHYQAIRRCYRFGQKRPVNVHVFASEAEGSVVENLKRKEKAASEMAEELSRETRECMQAAVRQERRRHMEYQPKAAMEVPSWLGARR